MTSFKDVQPTRKQRKLLERTSPYSEFAKDEYAALERYHLVARHGGSYERDPNGEAYLIFRKRERWYNVRLWLALGVSGASLAVAFATFVLCYVLV